MVYPGSFARWYVSKLKTHPFMTNMSSALVLMATGDVFAQHLEVNKGYSGGEQDRTMRSNVEGGQRLPLKRYGTLGPVTEENEPSQATNNNNPLRNYYRSSTLGTSSTALQSASVFEAIQQECWFWNPFRTGTMVAWSVGAYTPFFIVIYRLYDRYLPKQTPIGITARVGLSFLLSMPVNAAFYVYGTAVNHSTEWWSLRKEWRYELCDMGFSRDSAEAVDIPYDFGQLYAKSRRKLESELYNTVTTSGQFWIPINFFTFTVVPVHLRPLSLMFFSVFWNCYLSLAQHRDLTIPSDAEQEPPKNAAPSSSS
jgi:hypothetical protein